MLDPLNAFKRILHDSLIPEYCQGAFLGPAGAQFRESKLKLNEDDARNFVQGWEAQLLSHIGGRKYRGAKNGAAEKFFHSRSKALVPRTFTLAQESVIAVAALARLHFAFQWPKDLLGTQSKDHSFDAVAFLPNQKTEHVACEVKTCRRDIDRLLSEMQRYCFPEYHCRVSIKEDAFKKVLGLRTRRAPIFWAIAPSGVSEVFNVSYQESGAVVMKQANESVLKYPLAK